MSLMFNRNANNFAQAGFFPTDDATVAAVLTWLTAPESDDAGSSINLFDPCAGEGKALQSVQQHLTAAGASSLSYGIEYDKARASEAKTVLQRAVHADMQQCVIGRRQYGLLWLNPPYGDVTSDSSFDRDRDMDVQRLEKLFYQRTVHSLQFGGVMVLIVPRPVLDKQFTHWLKAHFGQLRVWLAPEQRFNQVVVMGVRKRSADPGDTLSDETLAAIVKGDLSGIPVCDDGDAYVVPTGSAEPVLYATQADPAQLTELLQEQTGLWPEFHTRLARFSRAPRQPLQPLSRWHQSLALAAGYVSGVIEQGGRVLVVRGQTYKSQVRTVQQEYDEATEQYREVTTLTDRFVPSIRALDITPGGPLMGDLIIVE